MKKILTILFIFTITATQAQSEKADITAIKKVMADQQQAWNNFDLEGFMSGYWKSDSLKFFGKSGITYGWEQTLARYKKGYPDKSYAGELNFKLESITPIESDSSYVMGRFYLTREVGNAEGIFLIIFRRIDGEWKIVADMSCG